MIIRRRRLDAECGYGSARGSKGPPRLCSERTRAVRGDRYVVEDRRSPAACSCDVVPCGPVSQLIISVSLSPRDSKASHALKQNHRNTNFATTSASCPARTC